MKKFLLSMLLILIGAMWSSVDARWNIGERKNASQIKAGDTVVVEMASRVAELGYFLQAVNTDAGVAVHQGLGIGDAAIITFEEGPTDLRTGAPTVYFKLVNSGKYIGQLTGWGSSVGTGVVSDPAKAANFQIISCAEDIPWSNTYAWDQYQEGVFRSDATYTEKEVSNWRNNKDASGGGRGSDNNSVGFCWSSSESEFNYLAYWYMKSPNAILWGYTDTNQWNVYEVTYEKSLQDDLADLIDAYTSNTDVEFIPGTDPGYYGEAEVEAYDEAMMAAMNASANSGLSDEEYQQAISDLMKAREAVENSLVKITEGYYYFVSGFEDFLNNFNVEKAAYIDPNVPNLKYKTFDEENVDFVFHVTPATNADEFFVQSYANGYYVSKGTVWYNSNPAATIDPEEPQNIRLRYTGLWFWGSQTYNQTSYTPYASNTPTAADGAGNITTWGVWDDPATVNYHSNLWNLRKISDEKMDLLAQKKNQADLDAQLKALAQTADELYGKLFVYLPDYDNPLITTVSGGLNEEPADDNQLTFSNIRGQGVANADKYEYLIDGDTTTYMQGSGYISIKLKEPKQIIAFVYDKRGATEAYPNAGTWGSNERPDIVRFYGCNTLEGDTAYGAPLATNVSMGKLPLPATYTFDFGRPMNRVAYYVDTNANGGTYFTLSEFQMYEASADKDASQYYTVEGLSEKADAMKALAAAKRAVADSSLTTADDIAELQAAIAAVSVLYADTTKLIELVDKATFLAQNTEAGESIGQIADEAAITTLSAAIDAAKELGLAPSATKADLDKAIANLQAAIDAFLTQIKSFQSGKWYYILNADKSELGTINGKALYTSGFSNTSATKVGNVTDGNPDYLYDPYSMWRFVEAEDGTYYVQNLGTGFYLPGGSSYGNNVGQSYEPVAYTVEFSGNSAYTFTPQAANSHNYVIAGKGENAVFLEAGVADSTTWQLVEIDTEETYLITIKDFKLNAMDIFALPYNVSDVASLNEGYDCHLYGIKKMTYNEETDETTIEFYEKDNIAANEAAFFVFGNTAEDEPYEEFELMLPFPTEVVDKLDPSVSNGIYGMLHPENIAEGIAYGSGKGLVVAGEGGTGISAHTGAIDPKYYKGEVEDVKADLIMTVKGLVWPKATGNLDVNGDGEINSSDVVAIYDHITNQEESNVSADAADANGDGDVNSSDVVAIYDYITNNQ